MPESKEHHYCPSHPNPLCPMNEGKGQCGICGFDHDKKSLSREDLRVRWEAAGAKGREALAKHVEEEKRTAKAEAEALKEELARLKAQMKEKEEREEAEKAERQEAERKRREAEEKAKQAELIKPGRIFRDAPYAPELVVIPAGRFLMGSPESETGRSSDEGPQHWVEIKAFAAGRYAVTFEEYDTYARETGKMLPKDEGWGRSRRPVINVSWNDAQGYVEWLKRKTGKGYRLLSEAEWEYACRAGTMTSFYTGNTISSEQANCNGNYTYGSGRKGKCLERTSEVGSYPPNGFGLYDMHGNVWEWVEDRCHDNYQGAPCDGSAWVSGNAESRLRRGGSWGSNLRNLRSAFRSWINPVYRNDGNNCGFRIARTLP